MSCAVHYIVPFANNSSDECAHALSALQLPHLGSLARRWASATPDEGDDYVLSPPHERAMAAAWGRRGAAGALPFAAAAARADGIDTGDLAWGLLTPTHWHLGREHITLLNPDDLALDEAESRGLLNTIRELFESEGFLVSFGGAMRWYLAHESLDALACASLDRVIGRPIDLWLPSNPQARLIRRIQNEVQMLLYQSPLNDAREARGQLPVNSFWLSGCGRYQAHSAAQVRVLDTLRQPALRQDWAAWCQAWQALDAGPLAELLEQKDVTLTLCGERQSLSLSAQTQPAWQRLTSRLVGRWQRPSTQQILGTL